MPRQQKNNPCAACKHRRKGCTEDCVFAPYFPSHDKDQDFKNIHRFHGSVKITNFIKAMPEGSFRDDAVATITFAANARARDPVSGCVSYIQILENRLIPLEIELANIQRQLNFYRNNRHPSQKVLGDARELLDFFRNTGPSSSGQQQELALFPMEDDDPLMGDLNEEEEPGTLILDDDLGALLGDSQGGLVSGDQSGQVGNMNASTFFDSGVSYDDGSGPGSVTNYSF